MITHSVADFSKGLDKEKYSIKQDNENDNSELGEEFLPLTMRQDTVDNDELKRLSMGPGHLASYLKTDHNQMTQREES